jgi:Zn-dependent peptidase ImmA (M78 family)
MNVLLSGVSKNEFSLNSRGSLRVTDVELIIKDVLRKQQRLKELDPGLGANAIVGMLRRPSSFEADATLLRERFKLDLVRLRSRGSKGKAFEYLVTLVEAQNIFVSQSVRNWMPQNLPARARFAGMCLRDKAIPFIFINSADARGSQVPAGRQLLTLVLLTVCVARGKFRRVSYNDDAENLIESHEYEIAEEVLMPAVEVTEWTVGSIDDVLAYADRCSVTPSAFLMRARRLGLVDQEAAREWSRMLREEFGALQSTPVRQPKPVNALRKYNSAAYSREFLRHYDAGRVGAAEVVRYLFQNRLKAASIESFREAL